VRMSMQSRRSNARRLWLAWVAAVLYCWLLVAPALAQNTGLPPVLTPDEVERVDFTRSDVGFRSLFSDLPGDRPKIERLLNLYNRAVANLGPEEPWDADGIAALWFMPRVHLMLTDGRHITLVLHNGVTLYADTPERSRRVTDPEVSAELSELASSYFLPAEGVTVDRRTVRIGQTVTVRGDNLQAKEVQLFLMPSYWPRSIPSAPAPYPVPEALLVATVPVTDHRFTYTFTVIEEMGRRLNGSPGKVGPGAWELVVKGDAEWAIPMTILPPGPAEPRAVVYDRERVLTWDEGEGVRIDTLVHPADRPLLVETGGHGVSTYISLDFLQRWLEIPVVPVGPHRYRIGPPELGLTVEAGEDYARVSGTMFKLGGVLEQQSGRWRLPWSGLGFFFDYRVQWLGPERVAFLRNLNGLPAEVQEALASGALASARGRPITVTLAGRDLHLAGQAYLDPGRNRVMVPLRTTVEALGGRVEWFPLNPGWERTAAGHNYGMPPTGGEIDSYVDVTLGDRLWRVYLTPDMAGPTVVPLRDLALAFSYELVWNGTAGRVDILPAIGLR